MEVKDGPTTLIYEGPDLLDVLKQAGVAFGEQLRGRRTPTVALCEAADKYRVAMALAEIDPAVTDKVVVVGLRCNGQALNAEVGPIRLLIPQEKRKLRWIRMLRTIRVLNLIDVPLTPAAEQAGGAPPK